MKMFSISVAPLAMSKTIKTLISATAVACLLASPPAFSQKAAANEPAVVKVNIGTVPKPDPRLANNVKAKQEMDKMLDEMLVYANKLPPLWEKGKSLNDEAFKKLIPQLGEIQKADTSGDEQMKMARLKASLFAVKVNDWLVEQRVEVSKVSAVMEKLDFDDPRNLPIMKHMMPHFKKVVGGMEKAVARYEGAVNELAKLVAAR